MAFRFKQFSVEDSLSAMKIGTDSVILGAWADVIDAKNIMDVGTGCGLLALMCAQRSDALITAIDIDINACKQAENNFKDSPWSNRLQCIHLSLKDFTKTQMVKGTTLFDHIITNPPYFNNSLKSPDTGRNTARHNDDLPFNSLLEDCSTLLNTNGKLSVIIPFSENGQFESLATDYELTVTRKLIILPKTEKEPNRILMEFTKGESDHIETGQLSIRDLHRNYTKEYVKLTELFYLGLHVG
jgi:tRNA1Val (adenine37-N6)-methyltransferase